MKSDFATILKEQAYALAGGILIAILLYGLRALRANLKARGVKLDSEAP